MHFKLESNGRFKETVKNEQEGLNYLKTVSRCHNSFFISEEKKDNADLESSGGFLDFLSVENNHRILISCSDEIRMRPIYFIHTFL